MGRDSKRGACCRMAGLMIGAASIAVLSATLSASSPEQEEAEADPAVMTAARAQQPVVLDGRLDDPVWSEAPVYELGPTPPNSAVLEGGRVQLAWDDQFLYVAATVLDSDVVAESDEDQAPHFRTGDVVEVFLKPQGKLYYWELYATPHARKTAYFFPSRGRGWLPSSGENPIAMHVAAAIDGTLNDWKDRDHGWTAEIAIPQAELRALGDPLGRDAPPWRILIGRYNYSAYLDVDTAELSCVPTRPGGVDRRFNLYEYWADLYWED